MFSELWAGCVRKHEIRNWVGCVSLAPIIAKSTTTTIFSYHLKPNAFIKICALNRTVEGIDSICAVVENRDKTKLEAFPFKPFDCRTPLPFFFSLAHHPSSPPSLSSSMPEPPNDNN